MSSGADYRPPGVDLSGFGKRASTVPPPAIAKPARSEPAQPAEPAAETPVRRPARPGRRKANPELEIQSANDGKVQFFVHLPPEQHVWLRERATAAGWPKREVILEAFLAHRDALQGHDADTKRRSAAGLPPREPGRRKEVGGIPSNVYMGRAEAEVLDRHARDLGMSRSQMVSELLALAGAASSQPRRQAKAPATGR